MNAAAQDVQPSEPPATVHPPCDGTSGLSGRAICGAFAFFLGAAILKLAFYMADEPNPPLITRWTYFVVGAIAAGFIVQATFLVTPIYCLVSC